MKLNHVDQGKDLGFILVNATIEVSNVALIDCYFHANRITLTILWRINTLT